MDERTVSALVWLAGSTGVLHTLAGPDHYLPFVAMARAGGWSLLRTLVVTCICGLGHVLGSAVIGVVGIALAKSVAGMEALEAFRGDLAAWLLVGVGLAYMVWGIRRAIKSKPHTHEHVHPDGTVHEHHHTHFGGHAHVHHNHSQKTWSPWLLFTLFIFGPCEVLIPALMVPAAKGAWWIVGLIVAVFACATILTMVAIVAAGYYGATKLRFPFLEKYAHASAGFALAACGGMIMLGL